MRTTCKMFGGPIDGQTMEVEDGTPAVNIPMMDPLSVVVKYVHYPYGHPKHKPWGSTHVTYVRDTSRPDAFVFQPDL